MLNISLLVIFALPLTVIVGEGCPLGVAFYAGLDFLVSGLGILGFGFIINHYVYGFSRSFIGVLRHFNIIYE